MHDGTIWELQSPYLDPRGLDIDIIDQMWRVAGKFECTEEESRGKLAQYRGRRSRIVIDTKLAARVDLLLTALDGLVALRWPEAEPDA